MHSLIFEQEQLIHSQISRTETEFKTYTLPFMKISREHNLSGSSIFIKNQTPIKVWPLRSELSVFTRSFEPLTRSPTECNNACFPSLCWTKDLWPDYPRVQNVLWKHLTLNSLYHACQCYSKRLTLMQNDQHHYWSQILSTFSLGTLILSTFKISRWPLILTQTTANITDARHCNPSPSSLILILLDMHTPSKARIPQVLIIPQHQPFINPLQNYLAKLLAQRKNTTTSQVLPKPALYTSLYVSHLHSWSILLDLRSYQPTTTFCPLPALVPSTFPHQYSTIPHHHLRRLFPALHNTPTKRKASPCIICNSNGEIPAAKMTVNKQKANLKNMLCSHQWGDLLFGHTTSKDLKL